MASYVVMLPPRGAGADVFPEFVRDGFSAAAFLVPPLWLAWHRLWVEALLALGLLLAVLALAGWLGMGAALWLWLLLALAVGLEGPSLRLAACRRRGWKDGAVIEADGLRDAEIRFAAESYAGRGAA